MSKNTFNSEYPLSAMESEGARANVALNDYYLLGDYRSLDKLLAKYATMGKPTVAHVQTLKNWSSKYHWQERVKAQNEIAARVNLSGYADTQKERLTQWSNDTWEVAQTLLQKATAMLNSDTANWTMDTASRFIVTADKLARLAVGEDEAKLRANERQKTFSELMTIMQNNLSPDTFNEVLRCLHSFSRIG